MTGNDSIGAKIRALRTARGYTLKQLSDESGLSVGFLSQLERGMSSIALDSLLKITAIFQLDLSTFFAETGATPPAPVCHSFDPRPTYISPQILQYILSRDVSAHQMLPRVFLLMPFANMGEDQLEMYSHQGEEFLYVLEGVVTVYLDGAEHTLYPGDSIQIHSSSPHNWMNRTNQNARLLTVNLPNPLQPQGGA